MLYCNGWLAFVSAVLQLIFLGVFTLHATLSRLYLTHYATIHSSYRSFALTAYVMAVLMGFSLATIAFYSSRRLNFTLRLRQMCLCIMTLSGLILTTHIKLFINCLREWTLISMNIYVNVNSNFKLSKKYLNNSPPEHLNRNY